MSDDLSPTLMEILLFEKHAMHPLNSLMAYVIAPVYFVVSVAIIVAFGVLMSIDDEKYLVTGLCLIGAFALITVGLLAILPFIKKKVIREQIDGYDFDTSALESKSEYTYESGELKATFDCYGMYLNDNLYYYNHMESFIFTNNYLHWITITLCFNVPEGQFSIQLLLNAEVLKMISDFDIKIKNKEALDYIVNNKDAAFEKIYNFGKV